MMTESFRIFPMGNLASTRISPLSAKYDLCLECSQYCANAFEVFEAAIIDVLGWTNHYGDTPIETVTAGTVPEIVCTFGVLRVRPNVLLADTNTEDFDAVAIPGGFESQGFFKDAYSEDVLQTLRDFEMSRNPSHPFVSAR